MFARIDCVFTFRAISTCIRYGHRVVTADYSPLLRRRMHVNRLTVLALGMVLLSCSHDALGASMEDTGAVAAARPAALQVVEQATRACRISITRLQFRPPQTRHPSSRRLRKARRLQGNKRKISCNWRRRQLTRLTFPSKLPL